MHDDLDALVIALYVRVDDLLPARQGPGRPPQITDAELIEIIAGMGARFLRPDRRNEPRRNGSLGAVRQWIESVFWTCKGQLTLEQHGGRTIEGLCTRVALRLLALAPGLVHNQQIGDPGRHFAAYGH